jgi:transcriptional regulator with XRE-family HTH domain
MTATKDRVFFIWVTDEEMGARDRESRGEFRALCAAEFHRQSNRNYPKAPVDRLRRGALQRSSPTKPPDTIMTRAADPDQAQRLQRVLGDELREARKHRRLTRRDMLDQLGLDLSTKTLATYELGTRTLNVIRLVELADVLGVSAVEVLARALRRMSHVEPPPSVLPIDLAAVVRDGTPALAPLRQWARAWLDSLPDRTDTVVRLKPDAVESLAEICAVNSGELARLLDEVTGPGPESL